MGDERDLTERFEDLNAEADDVLAELSESIESGLPDPVPLARYVGLLREQLDLIGVQRRSGFPAVDPGPAARLLAGALDIQALQRQTIGDAQGARGLRAESAALREAHPDTEGPLDVEAWITDEEAGKEAALAAQDFLREFGVALERHQQALEGGDIAATLAAAEALIARVEARFEEVTAPSAPGAPSAQTAPNGAAPPSSEIASTAELLLRGVLILAQALQMSGASTAAETQYDRALDLSRARLTQDKVCEVLESYGNHLLAVGRFAEALEMLEDRRDLLVADDRNRATFEASTAIAKAWSWLGDHERVLETLSSLGEPEPERAFREWRREIAALDEEQHEISAAMREVTERQDAAAFIRAKGRVERRAANETFGADLRSLLDVKERQQDLARRRRSCDVGVAGDLAAVDVLQMRARAYRTLGELERALAGFEVVARFWEGEEPEAVVRTHIADLHVEQGRAAEGAALAADCEGRLAVSRAAIARLPDAQRVHAEAKLLLGDAKGALARLETAHAAAARSLPMSRPETRWKIEAARGRTLEALGRSADALVAYEAAAEIVGERRRVPLGYRLDSTYLRDKLPLFHAAIRLGAELGEAARCAAAIERVKARALAATLSLPRVDAGADEAIGDIAGDIAGAGHGLARRLDDLSRRLDALEYEAYGDPQGWSDERRERRSLLGAERSALLERIRLSDPRWRRLTESVPFDPQQIADRLAERDQSAISLYRIDDGLIAVLARAGAWRVERLAPTPEALRALDLYIENVEAARQRPERYDPESLGLAASDLIPAPLLEEAIGSGSLVVVPHGKLHLLPWAGLSFAGARLFEHVAVGVLPSLNCLTTLAGDFPDRPAIALLGAHDYAHLPQQSDLAGVVAEIDAVADLYPSLLAEPVLGRAATEEAFRALAARPDAAGAILHVACHGTQEVADPLSSGLLLYDGKADAGEIRQLRIRYDEVVLSACSTAYRPTRVGTVELTGDDIIGLPGALLEAGASSVLVSIPHADDRATTELMVAYHRRRAQGIPPLHALQGAQREMLAAGAHPVRKWIGFTVYGCR